MIEVIPSILTDNTIEAWDLLSQIGNASKRVSIDVIDGVFADNKTVRPELFAESEYDFLYEFQLTVKEPENWIEACLRGGADCVIGHIEMMSNQSSFVGRVQEAGKRVGLALDLDSGVEKIDKELLKDLDVILLMSVPAGFGGQKFNEGVFKKIEMLNKIRMDDKSPFRIQVDGGVTTEVMKKLEKLGVDEVSVGRLLFKGRVADNINKYQMSI